ncbi:hypothetical protein RND71_021661 [Anisodus tanguticus]|uniref:Uncharacterized protein n=1 Tax=Anisodus tanguticus TaxID=243964 RepID=A0AAE1RYJ5_9SOLA|nr:hypothetical protein RND71_021661 [Anisodus tanguticus]
MANPLFTQAEVVKQAKASNAKVTITQECNLDEVKDYAFENDVNDKALHNSMVAPLRYAISSKWRPCTHISRYALDSKKNKTRRFLFTSTWNRSQNREHQWADFVAFNKAIYTSAMLKASMSFGMRCRAAPTSTTSFAPTSSGTPLSTSNKGSATTIDEVSVKA